MEIPKRIQHSKKILIQLFAKSNNECSFPECRNKLIDEFDNCLGRIGHIEGVHPGSARFNPNMTNEERANEKNLILLCGYHHDMIDKQKQIYTKQIVLKMKEDHQNKCSMSTYSLSENQINQALHSLNKINENIDQIATIQNLSKHKEEPIHYTIDETTRGVRSRKVIHKQNLLLTLVLAIFISFYLLILLGVDLLNFTWILGILVILLFILIYRIAPNYLSGKKEFFDGNFLYKRNSDGNVEFYKRTAKCNWPHCDGFVNLFSPPPKETTNHQIIGRCSEESKHHTFTYQSNNFGFYCKMDFSEKTEYSGK